MNSKNLKQLLYSLLPPCLFYRLRNIYRKKLRKAGKTSEVYVSGWPQANRVNGARTFQCRSNRTDQITFNQVFRDQEYNIGHLPRGQEMLSWYEQLDCPLVIDCGANIGASALFLHEIFPKAKIACFEPDAENFALIQANLSGIDQVTPVLAAVGANDGWMRIINPDGDPNSFRTESCHEEKGAIKCISIPSILSEMQGTPYFLKVDIEGGESDLFSKHHDVLHRFPIVAVEIHDWLYPGQGTSRSFIEWHLQRDRDLLIYHEMLYSVVKQFQVG